MKYTALAMFAMGLVATAARAVDVTACGQVVPAREVGMLTADLDCSGEAAGSQGVVLQHRASLQLNGNTIFSPPAGPGVYCAGARCSVSGPGYLLSSMATPGVGIAALKNVTVSNIEIVYHTAGISAPQGRVTALETHLSHNGDGIVAKKVKARNLFVRDSTRVGVSCLKDVRGEHIEVRNNGWAGVQTSKFSIIELVASGNGATSTTVGGGIFATRRGLLVDSVMSANRLAGAYADVVTAGKPLLFNSTCAASVVLTDTGPAGTWGVCTLD